MSKNSRRRSLTNISTGQSASLTRPPQPRCHRRVVRLLLADRTGRHAAARDCRFAQARFSSGVTAFTRRSSRTAASRVANWRSPSTSRTPCCAVCLAPRPDRCAAILVFTLPEWPTWIPARSACSGGVLRRCSRCASVRPATSAGTTRGSAPAGAGPWSAARWPGSAGAGALRRCQHLPTHLLEFSAPRAVGLARSRVGQNTAGRPYPTSTQEFPPLNDVLCPPSSCNRPAMVQSCNSGVEPPR